MRILQTSVLVLAAWLIICAFALRGSRGDECRTALEPAENSFWNSTQPQRLSNGSALTYAYDSELPDADVYRALHSTPAGQELIRSLYGRFKVSVADLADAVGVSEKQIIAFGLRKDVDRKQAGFTLADLNAEYLAAALNSKRTGLRRYWNIIRGWLSPPQEVAAIEQHLRDQGLPVRTHLDYSGLQVEVTHEQFEFIPANFHPQVVKGLHATFKYPQTHLHLGIPAAVSSAEAHAIGRAIETKIILGWAAGSEEAGSRLLYYKGSNLRRDVREAQARGSVRLQLNEWTKPELMHNLEIRQWDGIGHGLGLLALAGRLAQAHERLRILEHFDAPVVDDPYTGNLNGALRYAAILIMRDPAQLETGRALHALAREMEAQGTITPALRKKTHRLLNQKSVLNLLDESIFLIREE